MIGQVPTLQSQQLITQPASTASQHQQITNQINAGTLAQPEVTNPNPNNHQIIVGPEVQKEIEMRKTIDSLQAEITQLGQDKQFAQNQRDSASRKAAHRDVSTWNARIRNLDSKIKSRLTQLLNARNLYKQEYDKYY